MSKRLENESFEEYRDRLAASNRETSQKLKGELVWTSVFYEPVPDSEGNPKLKPNGQPIMQRFAHTYRKGEENG